MDWLDPLRRDTERIRGETKKIKEETEQIRQENQRIREESERIRQSTQRLRELRMKITENELKRIFNGKTHWSIYNDDPQMNCPLFIQTVTEILAKFDIKVTKEPSDLEKAIAGNKEAARRFLMEMGILDKDGNLTENYAPLEEPEPKPVGHEFWVIMLKRRDGKVYTDLAKTDGKMYLEFEDAIVALNQRPDKEYYHIVKMIANLEE